MIVLSQIDKIIRLSVVETVSKEIKMSEYLGLLPKGMYAPSQQPTLIIFHTDTEIYATDIDNGLKIVPFNFRKFIESKI